MIPLIVGVFFVNLILTFVLILGYHYIHNAQPHTGAANHREIETLQIQISDLKKQLDK